MIKIIKDFLGINVYFVERRSIYDVNWYNIGIGMSHRTAQKAIKASRAYSDQFPHLHVEYRLRPYK